MIRNVMSAELRFSVFARVANVRGRARLQAGQGVNSAR